MDTSKLIKRVKKGDHQAFKELYDQYGEYTIRVATAVLRNPDLAKDAVQETFMRVFRNVESYDDRKAFEPWLYKILLNECKRLLKKEKALPSPMERETMEVLSTGEDLYLFQEHEGLYQAIKDLDINNRIPIVLKYVKGFTEKEIAELMDLNPNTVKSRLFKGKEKLRRAIEGGGSYE